MENALVALSNELAATVEQAGKSVVTVHGRPRVSSSGVIWKPGVVVTAEHTLRREEDLKVTLPDGTTVPAVIAGRDPGTDLAVLRAEGAEAAIGHQSFSQTARPGNLVLTVGRSQDSGVNAALGVISSVSGPWHTWRGGMVDQFIRLDVGLYPGSSGGAAISAKGNLIGIATGGLSRTSALAIPVETISRVVDALLENGHIARGYLGVGLQPVVLPPPLKKNLNLAERTGLIVLSVEPEGPAGQAGMGIGDVLVSLNGKPVADTDDVQAALGPESVGKALAAVAVRGGLRVDLTITVGERQVRRG